MVMHVNVSEILPLTSKEFNQSSTNFILHNQRCNRTCYREHLETHEGDTFDEIHTRTSGRNEIILKDSNLDTVRMVIDPNQPPAKTSSKLKFSIFTNSNVISCVEVYFYAIQTNAIENEQQNVASTIDKRNANARIIKHFKPNAGSNHCRKSKEMIVEKL